MKNTMRWQLTSSVLHGFIGSLETAYGYSKDLNESLNNIRIVTNKSADDMANFAKQANDAAKALSTTTVDYTDASLIYYQQGLSDEEVLGRTETTIKLANVARESAEDASEQLTAVWNNFYDGSKSLEYYADVMTALGASTASSSQEIAEGLQKFAAVADTVGLSYEYAASALATVTATTRQSADVVGTAFKTLFARIQDLSLGETLDDGTTLGTYSQALASVGISIKEANGNLKDMDNILDEMGAKWDKLNKDQQVALAQQVAGVRQYNQLIALMENWDFFKENLATAQGAEGALQQQADIYAESWEAARDRVKASAEDIYDSLINPDFFIGVDNVITPLLSGTADVIDALGGVQGILSVVAIAMNKVYGDKIAQGMRDMAVNLGIITGKEAERARLLQAETIDIINNLSSTYAANTAESMRLNILKEEVQIQGEINAQYDRLDDYQKQVISNEQYKLDILKQETLATVERISQLQNSTRELQDTISVNIGTDDWQTRLRDEIRTWNQNHSAGYQINITVRANSNLDRVYQDIMTQLDALTKKRAQLQSINDQFVQLDSSSSTYAQSLRDLVNAYDSSINTASMTTQQLENYLKGLGTQATNTGAEIRELGNLLTQMGADRRVVSSYIAQLQQLKNEVLRGEISQEQYNERIREFSALLQSGIPTQKDWAATLVATGTTISKVSIAINGLISLTETLDDAISGDIDSVEAFTKVLTSLSMLLPTITSLIKGVKIENVKNAIQFITTGAAAGTGAAGVASFSAALYTLLPIIGLVLVAGYAIVKLISAIIVTEKEARESIQKATDAYEEQKTALESLNSELKTTKERIEELNSQDSLTLVEQEELNKLQQQEASLQRQIELQNKLTQAAQKTQAAEIEKNFSKSNKSLTAGPDLSQFKSWNQDNSSEDWYIDLQRTLDPEDPYTAQTLEQNRYTYKEEYVDADTWFNSVTRGLDKTSDAYNDYLVEYRQWKDENEQITAEWIAENAEAIQSAEDNYKAYIDAIVNGAIEYNPETVAQMQQSLAEIRKNVYGSDREYQEVVLKPILDNQSVKQVSTQLYQVLSENDIDAATGLVSDSIKNELMLAGVSVDEFLSFINDRVDKTKSDIEAKFDDFDFDSLTGEEWNILMDINLDNFDTVEELRDFLDNYQQNDINVDVNGLDKLKELLDTLNESQTALEKALKSYKDQEGYLTMDQVQELIAADESYAQYIIKVGDAYKLTNQSLQALLDSERQEEQILDATIESMKDKYAVNTDYVQNYTSMWDELVSKASESDALSKYNFTSDQDIQLFRERTQALSDNAKAYQEGAISAAEYFDAIGNRINGINAGFHELNKEIDDNIDQTDLYEATLVAASGSIADGLIDLNKKFKSGSINMDEYYKGTISATKALISSQSKLNKNIIKNKDGTWELKEGVDQTTLSADEYNRAISDISNLNAWEQQVLQAQSLVGIVDSLVSNYDYLVQYADSFGAIDFTIDNNFDTTAQEFQDMCSSIGQNLIDLEQTNNESYKRILQGVLDQGITLADGLNTSAETLMTAMSNDASIAGAVINSTMHESSNTISSTSQAAGAVLSALGELISNFDYDLGFTPYVKSWGKLQIEDWLAGKATLPFELPTLGLKITGSGGDNLNNFVNALSDAGSYLSSQGTGSGQNGIYDYGYEPAIFDPNGVLDPNRIATDNIRDSGGSKKTYDEKDKKDLDDIEDRYHKINREIQNQKELLDDIDNSIDRSYGLKRLESYDKKLQELSKQQDNYNQKLEDAQEYLIGDTTTLKTLFNDSVNLDPETGEILNYQGLLEKMVADYNAAVDKYNNAVSGKTMTEEEHKLYEKELEAAEKLFDKRKKALSQYEDTLDEIQDIKNNIEDILRDIEDTKLDKIEHRLEVVVTIKDMRDEVRNLTKEIVESFGDLLTHGIQSTNLGWDQAVADMGMLREYQQTYSDYKDMLANATDATDIERIIGDLEDLQGQAISTAEALLSWIESIETLLPDAIDDASKRFSLFTDQLEHNESILDTIKELYALQGVTYKTTQGFNKLQAVSQEKLDAQLSKSKLQKEWYDNARVALLEAEAALAGVSETDAAYDTLKNNRDALLEEYNQAQEAYLSTAKDAMETAREMFEQEIEKASYNFGKAISNGMGLDLLQDKYDHYIEEEERYLDEVNEAYQVASWYNKLQADIDKTTNSAYKNQLKQLQEEIDIRREGNTLSEYDLEILEAKYKVLQAQMALEDAQNAKNQLRLVRDSQGNWNYQYTSNPDDIAEAEQQLLDAQNEYYNIAKEQVKQVTGDIIDMWQECNEKIKEIYLDETLTVEEREEAIAEIRRYYSQKILDLEEEKNIALNDMTEAGGEIIEKYGNTYDNVLDLMSISAQEFNESFDQALDDMESAMINYGSTIQGIAEDTGTSLEDLSQDVDNVSFSTDICRDSGLEAANAMWEELYAIQDLSEGYAELAESVYEYIYALRDLAGEMAASAANASGVSSINAGAGFDVNTDYAALMSSMIANGYEVTDPEYLEMLAQRNAKIDYLAEQGYTSDYWGTYGSETTDLFKKYQSGATDEWYEGAQKIYEDVWKDLLEKNLASYDTGGYTGDFQNAKLAFLHEKELVLNEEDTKNILAAVQTIRTFDSNIFSQIEKTLDSAISTGMALMAQRFVVNVDPNMKKDSIEQTVRIEHVEFPNVTSSDEISDAFATIVNDAAQWAQRRKD